MFLAPKPKDMRTFSKNINESSTPQVLDCTSVCTQVLSPLWYLIQSIASLVYTFNSVAHMHMLNAVIFNVAQTRRKGASIVDLLIGVLHSTHPLFHFTQSGYQVHPAFSSMALLSFCAIPLTPSARTCVPLLSLCRPTATFHPSSSCKTKTYRLPSVSRMLALST